MSYTETLLVSLLGALLTVHFGSLAIARWRLTRPRPHTREETPVIALIRPVCGVDQFEEETLRSSFHQHYPHYEVVFCVAAQDDPVIPLIRGLMAQYPQQPARLLIGDHPLTQNPKLNNLFKALPATQATWLAMADSNLLLPQHYLSTLLASWQSDTGLVSAPATGSRPANLWGSVECAMLNTHQARWQLLSDWGGQGFAQGKTLFWRRDILEAGGGLLALGEEVAEDVASTKLVRRAGRKVRLPSQLFEQPVGKRSLSAVWGRQLRWAKIRRAGFPALFLPEILLGALPTSGVAAWLISADVLTGWLLTAMLALWYGAEWAFAKSVGWPHSLRDTFALVIRDVMLPLLWVGSWSSRQFVWRGTTLGTPASTALPAAQVARDPH
ncbi:ceramide glucosyltransferase [Enterobacterales bacterium CwR94]|nr:ceramide glucosyltransferase [Enterobacterales bacterium CwR94]